MLFRYNNVYINDAATVTGPFEAEGPLSKYFDKSYQDLYFGMPTWEQAESKLITDSIDIVLNKLGLTKFNIDLMVSGDLLNQIAASSYAAKNVDTPYVGIYAACATSTLGIIMASNMIDAGQINTALCTTSSHNNGAEKQFRYPVEYGAPKNLTSTFTSTGGAAALLSNKKSGIKVESGTIGNVVDLDVKDVYNMGAVMAPAAATTIYNHLKETGRTADYYDLILTGDLGVYGKEILKDYLSSEYGIVLNKYEDAGTLLYDLKKQPVKAGASGPACLPLVSYGYIFDMMRKKKLKKVLLVATGALMSTTMVNQKLSIPAIAHAVSLEVARWFI